jgi:hypothetical protein
MGLNEFIYITINALISLLIAYFIGRNTEIGFKKTFFFYFTLGIIFASLILIFRKKLTNKNLIGGILFWLFILLYAIYCTASVMNLINFNINILFFIFGIAGFGLYLWHIKPHKVKL